jgi:hypothetical protein
LVRVKRDKVKVEVFVPLGSCVCDFAPLIEKVGRVTSKFKDFVEVQTRSIKSSEALRYGIQDTCVVVNGKIKLHAEFDESELVDSILQSGPIEVKE